VGWSTTGTIPPRRSTIPSPGSGSRTGEPTSGRGGRGPRGAVDGGDDRLERCGDDVGVQADAPVHLALHLALDVRGSRRVTSGAEGVLGVVQELDLVALPLDRVHERRDRAVALTGERLADPAIVDVHREGVVLAARAGGMDGVERERPLHGEVLLLEHLPD